MKDNMTMYHFDTSLVTTNMNSMPTTSESTSAMASLFCSFKFGNSVVLIDNGFNYVSNVMTVDTNGLRLVTKLQFAEPSTGPDSKLSIKIRASFQKAQS